MCSFKLCFCLAFALGIFLSFSYGQDAEEEGEERSSNIKRLETTYARKGGNKTNPSKFKQSLDHRFIEENPAYNLKNLVKQNLLGIDFFQDQFQLNGLEGGANQVLYNGVPLVGEDGETIRFDLIDYFFLDSIELLRGSAGALYGSGGAAGALNLIPTRALFNGQNLLKTDLFYESHNAGSAKVLAAGRKKDVQWKTGFSYQMGDGLTTEIKSYKVYDVPPYWQINTMFDLQGNLSVQDKISFSLLNAFQNTKNKSSISPEFTSLFNKDNLFASLSYEREMDEKNEFKTYVSYQTNMLFSSTEVEGRSLRSEDVGGSSGRQLFHNMIFHAENWTHFFPWLSFYGGVDFRFNATESTLLDLVSDENGDQAVKKERYEIAPTLQLLFNFDDVYILSLTARSTYHWTFGYNVSPDISFKYNYNGFLTLTFDYGRSFVTPTFKQNYYKWVHPAPVRFLITGNEKLKPETSDDVSLVISLHPKKWFNFEGEGFFYRFYNKIEQGSSIDTSKSGEIGGQYYIGSVQTLNKDGYIRAGANIKVKGSVLDSAFFYYAGYSYVHAVERESKTSPFTQSMMVAPHKVSGGLGSVVPKAKTKIELSAFWTDKRKYRVIDDSGDVSVKRTNYFIDLGFSLMQPIYQYFYIYLKMDNLLNRKDPNFLTQEGVNIVFGFMFKSDNLSLTNRRIQTKTLSWN